MTTNSLVIYVFCKSCEPEIALQVLQIKTKAILTNIENFKDNHLDLSDLPKGVYFIQFQIDNKIIVKKIIKK